MVYIFLVGLSRADRACYSTYRTRAKTAHYELRGIRGMVSDPDPSVSGLTSMLKVA